MMMFQQKVGKKNIIISFKNAQGQIPLKKSSPSEYIILNQRSEEIHMLFFSIFS
jgi:hypothetical protein